jgi:hypothetical protein
MTNLIRRGKIKFEKPGKYRIVVQGRLDESWSDRLAGMSISTSNLENDKPTTLLIGNLRDQAQLSGVLNSLYELHLPILSVNLLITDKGDPQDPDKSSPSRPEREDTR